MAKTVLIDSGAIVAALRKRDEHHEWARAQLDALTQPCLTCEAVISESFFLLKSAVVGKQSLCSLLERGIIAVGFSFEMHADKTMHLLRRYHDLPMSFADACMVRMAEMHKQAVVFTTDSDFEIYRKNGGQAIPLLKPWR